MFRRMMVNFVGKADGWLPVECNCNGLVPSRESPQQDGQLLDPVHDDWAAAGKAESAWLPWRAAATASTLAACQQRLERIAADLREAGQEAAAETVLRDVEEFLTFYDFPQEHWLHLRTTNPIESVFAGVRLRTNVTKRLPNADNALYLVFKAVERLAQHWRKITGSNLCQLVLARAHFVDGQMAEEMAAGGPHPLAFSTEFGDISKHPPTYVAPRCLIIPCSPKDCPGAVEVQIMRCYVYELNHNMRRNCENVAS